LVDRANTFLADHPKAEDQLRRLFTLKLATVREDGEPTGRRALRSEFTDDEWKGVIELADHPYRLLGATRKFLMQENKNGFSEAPPARPRLLLGRKGDALTEALIEASASPQAINAMVQRGRFAAIRHMDHVDSGHHLKQLATKMIPRSDAGRRHIGLAAAARDFAA
jgi:hypothetical protein